MKKENENSRRALVFGEIHATATERETERETCGAFNLTDKHDSRSTRTAQRQRTERQCRGYWRRMYGAAAERASRGGVSWIGGCAS